MGDVLGDIDFGLIGQSSTKKIRKKIRIGLVLVCTYTIFN